MNKLNVVIGGCGRVGRLLASNLESQGHLINIIDKDPLSFEEMKPGFKGKKFIGVVFDKETLEKAGIKEADVFVAVTSGDNSNIVSARTAQEYYRVPIVYARIYDPKRAQIYQKFGIQTIASATWAIARLTNLILFQDFHSEYTFGSGQVGLMEVTIPAILENKIVKDIEVDGEIKIASIVRGYYSIVPSSSTIFRKDDRLYVSVAQGSMNKFKKMLGMD